MEIAESIYEGVVETSYKKPTRADAKHSDHIRQNRGEAAPSHTHSAMGENAGKRRKQYADHPTGKSKTCLMYGSGNASDECNVLG